ncbi:glycosyltransferase family 4 protein [Dysgonomonas sp. Marseille-P4677]|uniref:glycosyltransferase family 4 protein n=1 Tax=Dysgonomonas sp. Marseille-P4677 TaxID=2364790 RepID=UPI0019114970|nr:glycosyltransferase family 4 protein [Dysgonomonas sp. Marseille-P4677]MBK5722334.1 glycosyltransferase family 4 protein [Dysgonomonas sp. Marseille-P4677]
MTKIAIVISRYGREINGGAELHARQLAEHLHKIYDVTVLTTCENDDSLIRNTYYPSGETFINNIKVIRFESKRKDQSRAGKLFRYLHKNRIYKNTKFELTNFFQLVLKKIRYQYKNNYNQIFEKWIGMQGPISNDLIQYIKENKNEYCIFIFFMHFQYIVYAGIQEVPEKSILVPIAHDVPSLYFRGFDKVFSSPAFIMYNSIIEKEWVEAAHPSAKNTKSDIAGVGRDKPIVNPLLINKLPEINFPFFIYIGRIQKNKGCDIMIDYFKYYKQCYKNNSKLVLIGKNFMSETDPSEDIIYTGFISEQEKLFYLQNAISLIIPSPYESLSAVTLEAMIIGKPVLANGHCDILKKHIDLSNAGYNFYNKDQFCESLDKLLNMSDKEKETIANNGISYVEKNYEWKSIIDKYLKVIEEIS